MSVNEISNNDNLNYILVDNFIEAFNSVIPTGFSPIQPLHRNVPQPIEGNQRAIQIIFSNCDSIACKNEHSQVSCIQWVCTYYDGKNLCIYDSSLHHKLRTENQIILEKLYPQYNFKAVGSVLFHSVDKQSECNESLMYSMAFATSILFDLKPEIVRYSYEAMQSHVFKISKSKSIEHFPCQVPAPIPSLQAVQKKWQTRECWQRANKRKKNNTTKLKDNSTADKMNGASNPCATDTIGSSSPNEKSSIDIDLSQNKHSMRYFGKPIQLVNLHHQSRQCIMNNEWLDDDHMEQFARLFAATAKFKSEMRPQIFLYMPEHIQPVVEGERHVQILFSCNNLVPSGSQQCQEPQGGHWVCSYYDGKQVFIFDSARRNSLHKNHKTYLEKLLPFYDFHRVGSVLFPLVDQQPNGNDCALYAMAFATSILFDLNPENVRYCNSGMRPHLIKMFEKNRIELFPCSNGPELFEPSLRIEQNISSNKDFKNTISNPSTDLKLSQMNKSTSVANFRDAKKKSQKKTVTVSVDDNDPMIISTINTVSIDSVILPKKSMGSRPDRDLDIGCSDNKTNTNIDENGVHVINISDDIPENNSGELFCERQYRLISEGLKLNADHVEEFGLLLCEASNFEFRQRSPYHLYRPDRIEPVLPERKHIQILFSCDNLITTRYQPHENGHWVCSYYDTKNVYVFDSIGSKEMHRHHKVYLSKLFPYIDFDKTGSVIFPSVDIQSNGNDCGLFAIAFAVSIFCGKEPENILYNYELMREHCLRIFQSKNIEHFPCRNQDNVRVSLPAKRKIKNCKAEINNSTEAKKTCGKQENPLKKRKIVTTKSRKATKRNSSSKLREINDVSIKRERISEDNERHNQIFKKVETYSKDNYSIVSKTTKQVCDNKINKKEIKKKVTDCTDETEKQTLIIKRISKIEVAGKIKKKYHTFIERNTTIKTKLTKEKYIQNVTTALKMEDPVSARIEAERIIKWCFHCRQGYMRGMTKSLKAVKEKIEVCLTRITEMMSENDAEYLQLLCGECLHNASSEAYFTDATYKTYQQMEAIVMNAKGQAVNILPLVCSENRKTAKLWKCGPMCKTNDNRLVHELINYYTLLMGCSVAKFSKFLIHYHKCSNGSQPMFINDKLGHPLGCYVDPSTCNSKFLSLQILAVHFPLVRRIKQIIYSLTSAQTKLSKLDEALNINDIDVLQSVSAEAQRVAQASYIAASEINLDESEIRSEYMSGFRRIAKRMMDVPELACISCEKLCSSSKLVRITISEISYPGNYWDRFKDFLLENSSPSDENYICRYCHGKFKANKLPPTCILNNLHVPRIPDELTGLNTCEVTLIQRAKAFQVVQRANTVMNKKIPNKWMIPKAIGTNFILPLPIEETLKKICPPIEAINRFHELYILVRGIPTKSKVMWERLVDLKKIWNCLNWLKQNNMLYSKINLPLKHEELLPNDMNDVQYQEDSCASPSLQPIASLPPSLEVEDKATNIGMETEKKPALLTQKSESDKYYEHFTIYPMHEKRTNLPSTELYQMLKVHDKIIEKRIENLDLMCFPILFPYGENGLNHRREIKLTNFEFFKNKFMSKHLQFRKDIQYLFYALNDNNIRQMAAGIYHKLNVPNVNEKYTAGHYLDQLSKGLLESNLNTIFARLRNTGQYWRIPRNNLMCMTRYYGPATWFLTISPSEWLWDDLVEHLRVVNNIPSTAKIDPVELIRSDPVAASRFMNIKFKAMIDFICSDSHPIGEVVHYFWRLEYQGRGAPHWHLLIWIKDAPVIGVSSAAEIAAFIMKYVTCRIPNKNVSPQLHSRVVKHQKHVCNAYCMRTLKTKTGFVKRCRFGFPRKTSTTFKLHDVAVSVAGRKKLRTKSRLYELPRGSSEIRINDYNPAILCAWEGNMDIQFVGEHSTILTQYTTKYISKPEKSSTLDPIEIINSTKSVASNLWNWAMRVLSHRECGAMEAADAVLGNSLYGSDPWTTIKWVDVNLVRSRKLKARREIETLDDESTDLFCPSLIDTHYPNRPSELHSLNLFDFATWYDITKIKPVTIKVYKIDNSTYLKKRSRPCLVNHYIHNVETQPEKYYYSLLLLFKPWRSIDELKNNYDTYAEAFASVSSDLVEALTYHDKIVEIQKAIDYVKQQIEKNLALASQPPKNDSPDKNDVLECVPDDADDVIKDLRDAGDKLDTGDLPKMVSELNTDQTRIFNEVTSTLLSDSEVIRLYVSGEGGTGKSVLIKTIRLWIKKNLNKDTAVAAPTGIAAFNVDGVTIHRLFKLPVEHGRTPTYKPLSDPALKLLRTELKNVALIIIDEVSMISNLTLMYINLRLTEIYNTSECEDGWFGKKSIILFGDLLQLPPVHEEMPFTKLSKAKIEKYVGAMGSADLWSKFKYEELTINMRQKSDTLYRDILSRIRLGIVTDEDTKLLTSRKLHFKDETIEGRLDELCDYLCSLPDNTVCLLPTCRQCDILNAAMLKRIPTDEIELIAVDSIDCATRLKKTVSKALSNDEESCSKTAGMAKVITVKIGAQIMIRRNIDVSLGLINGTIGKIVSIQRDISTGDVESIRILLPTGMEYNIERSAAKFEIMDRAYVTRKQFPICLSYGMTVHKSQGLSLDNAVIEAGNSIFTCGQTYVAFSRVKSLNGLHLINYDPASVKALSLAIVEYNRLRKQFRPDLFMLEIPKCCIKKSPDTIWTISTKACDIQEEPTENSSKELLLLNARGLPNIDNVSCYANSIMQCLIHCEVIRNAILVQNEKDVVKTAVEAYLSENRAVDMMQVRKFVGEEFVNMRQQDAAEFMNGLCEKSESLQKAVQYELTSTTVCKTCGNKNIETQTNNILLLKLPSGGRGAATLQDIVDSNVNTRIEIDRACQRCQSKSVHIKNKILSLPRIMIIKLLLFDTDKTIPTKKKNCMIKAVPSAIVSINDCRYRVISAIFHSGNNIQEGHYITMLRGKGNAWIRIDDMKLDKSSWPRNARNAYIMYLVPK